MGCCAASMVAAVTVDVDKERFLKTFPCFGIPETDSRRGFLLVCSVKDLDKRFALILLALSLLCRVGFWTSKTCFGLDGWTKLCKTCFGQVLDGLNRPKPGLNCPKLAKSWSH